MSHDDWYPKYRKIGHQLYQVIRRKKLYDNVYELTLVAIKEKQQMLRPICFHWLLAGTLSADETFDVIFPFAVQLIEVQAKASNDSDATLQVGSTTDADAYMAEGVIGDSGAWQKRDRDDFINDQFPHIAGGNTIRFTLDFDGSSGTAGQNVEIMVTFTEG